MNIIVSFTDSASEEQKQEFFSSMCKNDNVSKVGFYKNSTMLALIEKKDQSQDDWSLRKEIRNIRFIEDLSYDPKS
jgi:hypothetical protein